MDIGQADRGSITALCELLKQTRTVGSCIVGIMMSSHNLSFVKCCIVMYCCLEVDGGEY